MQYLQQQHIDVLPWPALSSDLAPIEHIWDELGRRVDRRARLPQTLKELETGTSGRVESDVTEVHQNSHFVYASSALPGLCPCQWRTHTFLNCQLVTLVSSGVITYIPYR